METSIKQRETICAISTAPGEGGIAIVRASGRGARELLSQAFRPSRNAEMRSHVMRHGLVVDNDGRAIDEVMSVFFASPSSYTREDMIEIQCHGGNQSAQRVMKRLIALGARVAEAGEFTMRAFLNGRIDLSRAEAVMALIGSRSEAAARASVQQLNGGISSFVQEIGNRIKDALALIEACTDFPDEVEEADAAQQIRNSIDGIQKTLLSRIDERGARIVREGASIVIEGRPNVGKSSLMNALLHFERAIVTDIPGTTRDVLTESIQLGGIYAHLSDTAGQHSTDDPVEKIGVTRARAAARQADLRILLLDGSKTMAEEDRELLQKCEQPRIVCINKCDIKPCFDIEGALHISAREGTGLDELTERIKEKIAPQTISDSMMTNERHIRLARACFDALENAKKSIDDFLPLDVCAIDMMEALEKLSEITGENASEEVISRVFKNFCVGK